jgi:hypothetical protein
MLLASACAPLSGPLEVEVLLPSAADPSAYQLAPVTLTTVTDLHRGRTERFDVRGGFNINAFDLVEALRDEALTLRELIARSREEKGHDPSPRLTRTDGVYVGEDFDSLQYLTLLYNFERAWDLAEDIGDESPATQERSIVGWYGTISHRGALPLPIQVADNAAYVTFFDGWLTYRVVRGVEGVPFAMNPGLVAHELHHRLFFRNVFGEEAYEVWRDWVTQPAVTRSGNLVRALDEGLADLFGFALSGDAAFATPSLVGLYDREAVHRDLGGDFATEATYDLMATQELPVAQQRHCGFTFDMEVDVLGDRAFHIYCLGTLIARGLIDGAGGELEVLRGEVMPAVNRALPEVGRRIATASAVRGELAFELNFFLDAVAAEVPAARRRSFCAALRPRFESLFDEDKVPACG